MHEAELRYGDLREKLNGTREIFGAVWRESHILRPGTASFDGSRFQHEVEMIVGTRTPFARANVVTSEPLQNGQLYLWNAGNEKALLLLPLIKIRSSPKTEENACYYYNRIQGNKPRYLSYHFGADSDITLEDASDVIQALDRLGLS